MDWALGWWSVALLLALLALLAERRSAGTAYALNYLAFFPAFLGWSTFSLTDFRDACWSVAGPAAILSLTVGIVSFWGFVSTMVIAWTGLPESRTERMAEEARKGMWWIA